MGFYALREDFSRCEKLGLSPFVERKAYNPEKHFPIDQETS
jgi:hypothetical protein